MCSQNTCRLIIRVSGRQHLARLDVSSQRNMTVGLDPIALASAGQPRDGRYRRSCGRQLIIVHFSPCRVARRNFTPGRSQNRA
jgi:hypothetical protein